jgi:glycerophosphoryl diester phosphodiesterase
MTLVALLVSMAAVSAVPCPLGACAHRGDTKHYPENTLPAFVSAVAKGAHMIEFDVYLTKDGFPIIIHDNTVDRTTDGSGNVTDYLFEDLRQLDAGSWFDQKFAGTRIPTLQETLEAIPRYILCNVHLKNAPGLAATVAEILKEEDRLGHCFLACSIEQAREAKKVAPAIKICNMTAQTDQPGVYADVTIEANAEYLQFYYQKLEGVAEQVPRVQARGIVVNYFYANASEDICHAVETGINYILTDDLDTCLAVLEREYGISPARRPVQE